MGPICLTIISGLFSGPADRPSNPIGLQRVPHCDSTRKRGSSDFYVEELDPTLPSDTLTRVPPIRTKTKDFAAYEDVVYEYYVGKRSREIKHGLYQRVAIAGVPGSVIEAGYYLHNLRVGQWKTWYPTGQVQIESEYENGKLNGKLTSYHRNGIIFERQNLVDGRPNCLEEYSFGYHENGKLKFEVRIENGYVIQDSRFDSLGRLIQKKAPLENEIEKRTQD